jgi:hypothetical protein
MSFLAVLPKDDCPVELKVSLGLDFCEVQICRYLWLMCEEGEVNRSILKMYAVKYHFFANNGLVVCSFLAVKGNCQPHLSVNTETMWRSVFVVRTPHSVFMFVFVPLCYELTLIPSEHKIHWFNSVPICVLIPTRSSSG